MKILIKILLSLFFIACQSNSQKEYKADIKETVERIDSISHLTNTNLKENVSLENNSSEKFMDFFSNFIWDSEFQKSRIVFPITINGSIIESMDQWEHKSFYTTKSYMPILSTDTTTYFDKDVKGNNLKMSIISFEKSISNNYSFSKSDIGWELINVNTQRIDSLNDWDFLKFLLKFSSDSIFQINHVTFPIPNYNLDYDNDYEIIYDSLSIENWRHLKIIDDVEEMAILNMDIVSKYRKIFCRGIENGIHVHYLFQKYNSEWKLIKLEDYST